jgi:hypothetical protein
MIKILKISLSGLRKAVESAQGLGIEAGSLTFAPKSR